VVTGKNIYTEPMMRGFEGLFRVANEINALFKIGRVLGHEMSEFVYKEHWGIRSVLFAKHRDDKAEAYFVCSNVVKSSQKSRRDGSRYVKQIFKSRQDRKLTDYQKRSALMSRSRWSPEMEQTSKSR
jgi:hypothetical protein